VQPSKSPASLTLLSVAKFLGFASHITLATGLFTSQTKTGSIAFGVKSQASLVLTACSAARFIAGLREHV